MSVLKDIIVVCIVVIGFIIFVDYMVEVFLYFEYGYYISKIFFGSEGDFIIVFEISQMFGEVLGFCFVQVWMDQGCLKGILVELGLGCGMLMEDILCVM